MGFLPHITGPEMADSPSARHYHELIEQSRNARDRGDHWAAQQFATEAHKWAMDECTRLQRLAHARSALDAANKRLETILEKYPECGTVNELHECHPESRGVITTHEKAQQLVEGLAAPPIEEKATK